MTEVLISLLGGGLLAAGGVIWALVERNRATKARALARDADWKFQRAADQARNAADAQRNEREMRVEERAQLETVIVQLKAGIAQLEEDLDACDAGSVRDRLRRLLLLGGQAPAADGTVAAPGLDGLRRIVAPALGALGRESRR